MGTGQESGETSKEEVEPRKIGFLHSLRWNLGLMIENARVILPFSFGHLFRVREPKFRVPSPEGITHTISTLYQTEAGPIIEICFAGRYPPGSFGNDHANEMRMATLAAVQAHQPVAVLFNMRSLNYVWGDSILNIIHPLFDRETKTILPSCIFSSGRTSTALEEIFRISGISAMAGLEMFRDREEAFEKLKKRVGEEAV